MSTAERRHHHEDSPRGAVPLVHPQSMQKRTTPPIQTCTRQLALRRAETTRSRVPLPSTRRRTSRSTNESPFRSWLAQSEDDATRTAVDPRNRCPRRPLPLLGPCLLLTAAARTPQRAFCPIRPRPRARDRPRTSTRGRCAQTGRARARRGPVGSPFTCGQPATQYTQVVAARLAWLATELTHGHLAS
jgi:hypothetical protein